MASTAQKRIWWADWRCNPLKMKTVTFPGSERDWHLPVADAAVPAFQLFASLMRRHNYLFREVSGGTYNCRKIGGTDAWSLHAYGIAIDLNPSKNPFGTTRHDFPQGFIDDVLATGWFRWGLSFMDPMHWEIDVAPADIEEDDVMTPAQEAKLDQVLALVDSTPSRVLSAEFGGAAGSANRRSLALHILDIRKMIGALDSEGVSEAELDERVTHLLDLLPDRVLARLRDRLG